MGTKSTMRPAFNLKHFRRFKRGNFEKLAGPAAEMNAGFAEACALGHRSVGQDFQLVDATQVARSSTEIGIDIKHLLGRRVY